MKIQLKDWSIINLNFSLLENELKREKNSFDLEAGSVFDEEPSIDFGILFKVDVKDKTFDLTLDALFSFETDGDIDEDFKLSHFPKINAPAIAYPYLRAFISNLTLQSGLAPVILPTINFVKWAEEKNGNKVIDSDN